MINYNDYLISIYSYTSGWILNVSLDKILIVLKHRNRTIVEKKMIGFDRIIDMKVGQNLDFEHR